MDRRTFLRASAAGAVVPLAGCSSLFETQSVWTGGPIVEDRPDAVYRPAAVEEMATVATRELPDGSRCSLHYTYPHRFWTVTGEERTRVEVREGQVLHLMTSVWDPEHGAVLPRRPQVSFLQDGERVDGYQFWAMLAQRMGYHFGNNVALPDGGPDAVRLDLDPLAVRGTGSFAGAYDQPASVSFDVDLAGEDVFDLGIDEVPRAERGERAALEPMEMGGPPPGRAPQVEALPGTVLGTETSADAVVAATLLDSAPAGVDGDGAYLAVSLRTPYNRIALPNASVSADFDGGDAEELVESLDPALGHHYGAVLDERPASGVTVQFGAPPQVARHDGYETAFFELSAVEFPTPSG